MTTETMRAAFEAWCAIGNPSYRGDDDSTVNRRDWRVWQAATLAERERCARLCDKWSSTRRPLYGGIALAKVAVEIRKNTVEKSSDSR